MWPAKDRYLPCIAAKSSINFIDQILEGVHINSGVDNRNSKIGTHVGCQATTRGYNDGAAIRFLNIYWEKDAGFLHIDFLPWGLAEYV